VSRGLSLNNTLSKRKELFKAGGDNSVKLFTCGPSVYDRPHIGNYRSFLYEDVLQRYLAYLGYNVERLINFTDVEDKALVEAKEKGITRDELTKPVEETFRKEARLLNIILPKYIPRSSTSVEQAALLIKRLLDGRYAYRHGKDIFYDPLMFKDFGKLFGLDMSRWPKKKKRFRKDTYPGRRWNLGDFILWHGGGKEAPEGFSWETEIGRGRPAWNIQDAAMITKHLGYEVDICCGGVDNLYRHHDYTIAVIEALSGKEFCHYWLHGEHVLVDGAKMSKSKKNIVYVEDLLSKGFSPAEVRFFLVYGHYRQQINFSSRHIKEAAEKMGRLKEKIAEITRQTGTSRSPQKAAMRCSDDLIRGFERHMNDDLNVKGAIDAIQETLGKFLSRRREQRVGYNDAHEIRQSLLAVNDVLQVMDLSG
jgi:cysteinyl-tRNA synthetase